MAKDVQATIPVRPDFQVKRGTVKTESGLSVKKVASAIFDAAANDSSGISNKTAVAHGLGVFLPIGAIVTRAWFQTKTIFSSTNSTSQIALSVQAGNDLKTATAVSDAMYGTAIITGGVPDGTAAAMILLTAERELTATVSVEALLTGKLILFVEYVLAL